MRGLIGGGDIVAIPEIVFYELRRELVRMVSAGSISTLDQLANELPYIPLNRSIMIAASELWAEARLAGAQTADDRDLDVDVILAATARELISERANDDVFVATTNLRHLSRFVPAQLWEEIAP